MSTSANRTVSEPDTAGLPLPAARCLSKAQAASYLGIGVTLLAELDVPGVKFGRRLVYDRLDLDRWLDEYKQRGRARKEDLWPVKAGSTGEPIRGSGGSMQYFPMASAYAEALRPRTERKRKRF